MLGPPRDRVIEPCLQRIAGAPPGVAGQAAHVGRDQRRIVGGHRQRAEMQQLFGVQPSRYMHRDIPHFNGLTRTDIDGTADVLLEEGHEGVCDVVNVQVVTHLLSVGASRDFPLQQRRYNQGDQPGERLVRTVNKEDASPCERQPTLANGLPAHPDRAAFLAAP